MKARNVRRPASAGAELKAKPNSVRREILDAAADIIVRQGYDACTMRAVAALVDMKAGSLYYHFKSKDEIVEEIRDFHALDSICPEDHRKGQSGFRADTIE